MENYEKKYKALVGKIEKAYLYAQTDSTKAVLEDILPELAESKDEKIRKELIEHIKANQEADYVLFQKFSPEDVIAWLEKQGEKSDKWKEGDIVRHGGILALVIKGRNAMKPNFERIIIQYPDEWVKVGQKEREYFFEKLEKQVEKPQGKSALEAWEEETADNANKVASAWNNGYSNGYIQAIDKACEWLENHNDYIDVKDGNVTYFDMGKCVEDFRKAMNGGEE